MKEYLVVTKTSTNTKNKLQEAVAEYLRTIDRQTVAYHNIEAFINIVNAEIARMNAANPRCTPIDRFAVNNYDRERALEKEVFDFIIGTNGGQFLIYLHQIGK